MKDLCDDRDDDLLVHFLNQFRETSDHIPSLEALISAHESPCCVSSGVKNDIKSLEQSETKYWEFDYKFRKKNSVNSEEFECFWVSLESRFLKYFSRHRFMICFTIFYLPCWESPGISFRFIRMPTEKEESLSIFHEASHRAYCFHKSQEPPPVYRKSQNVQKNM
jgi:hypothetical protein